MENYLLFRTALEPLNKRVLEIKESLYPRRLIEAGEEKMLYGTFESEFRNFYKSQQKQGKLVTKIEFYNSLIEELNDIESGVLKFEKIYGISNSSLLDYIFSIKQFIEELIQQGGNKPQPAKRKINSKLTYKWLLKEDKIYELKKLLIDYELIDSIDFQSFKAIFSETPITQIKKAITWKNENVTQLIYLIKQLKENKIIDSTKTNFDYKQLYSCFVKNNDEIFTEKAKSLKTDIEIKISADFKLITEDIVNKLTK